MSLGKFITVEGGEGSGKSTLVESLAAKLRSHGLSVVTTFEPGDTILGQEIRKWLLHSDGDDSISPKTELLLFLADRSEHIQSCIIPALAKGAVVLCDRFNDSTVAYQGVARGLGMEYTLDLCNRVTNPLQPDLTILLDIDPAEGLQRAKHASRSIDRIESEQLVFHQNLRNGFLTLADCFPERIKIIDGKQPFEVVFNTSLQHIFSIVS